MRDAGYAMRGSGYGVGLKVEGDSGGGGLGSSVGSGHGFAGDAPGGPGRLKIEAAGDAVDVE